VRIAHAASHSTNIGDGALIQVLQTYMGDNIYNHDVVYDGTFLNPDGFDKIIIGGGGAIGGLSHDRTPMAYPVTHETLSDKMSFVAIGYNVFYGREYGYKKELKDLINKSHDIGIPFSVRMDGSVERIREEIGVDTEEVPDPGLFVEVDESYNPPQIDPSRPNVIIQIAGDNLQSRGNPTEGLAKVAELLIGYCDANIIVAPHIVRDLGVTSEFAHRMASKSLRKHICVTGIMHPRNAAQYFKIYKDADLVIGMRGHSVICGVGLGTPTIAIDSHPKVKGFMEKVGLGDWVAKDKIRNDFIISAAMGEIEFSPKLDGMREKLDNFMGRVMC